MAEPVRELMSTATRGREDQVASSKELGRDRVVHIAAAIAGPALIVVAVPPATCALEIGAPPMAWPQSLVPGVQCGLVGSYGPQSRAMLNGLIAQVVAVGSQVGSTCTALVWVLPPALVTPSPGRMER